MNDLLINTPVCDACDKPYYVFNAIKAYRLRLVFRVYMCYKFGYCLVAMLDVSIFARSSAWRHVPVVTLSCGGVASRVGGVGRGP